MQDLCPPDNDLILEWVHGYRGHDCRQSATYTTSGDVLFFAGTVLVRYSWRLLSLAGYVVMSYGTTCMELSFMSSGD